MKNKGVIKEFQSAPACPLKCAYCFAKLPEYDSSQLPRDQDKSPVLRIVYPACDSEIHADVGLQQRVRNLADAAHESRPVAISFSTKAILTARTLDWMASIHRSLTDRNAGLVKISISTSVLNSDDLNNYERGAAKVHERLHGLLYARNLGLPTSVNLKPILPHVDLSDYRQIVSAAVKVTNRFMLGGLYVSKNTSFGQQVLERYSHLVVPHHPAWLLSDPGWVMIEDKIKIQALKSAIRNQLGLYYDSDAELISSIWDELMRKFAA